MDLNDFDPFASGQDLFTSHTSNVNQATAETVEDAQLAEVETKGQEQAGNFNSKALEDLALGVNAVANPAVSDQETPTEINQIIPNSVEKPVENDAQASPPQISELTQNSSNQESPDSVEGNHPQVSNTPDKLTPTLQMPNLEELAQTHLIREEHHTEQLNVTKADQVEEKQSFEKFSKEVFVAIEHKNGDIDIVPYDPANKMHQAKSEKGDLVWKKGEEFAVATDDLRQKLQQTKGKIRHVAADGTKTEIGKEKVRKLTDKEAAEFKGLVAGYNQWNAVQRIGMQQAQQAKAMGQVDEKGGQGQVTNVHIDSGRVGTHLNER